MKSAPTTELALRIGGLFKRRPTTEWSEKEIKQYKKLVRAKCFESLDDLALVEQWYVFERKRGENGRQRRDLYTFLNNFQGEVDKANLWREQHPVKPVPRKIIPLPPAKDDGPPLVLSAEDEAQVGRFQQQFSMFKKIKEEMGR